MNIKRYKARLAEDLERWIAKGWVPAASRELILGDILDTSSTRTTLWLGMIGAVLAGLAIIAGVADNWALVPRALKLAVLLAFLWLALGLAIWSTFAGRRNFSNASVMLAAIVFAASIGLLGQALNIPGEPSTALLFGALGAGALGVAGGSTAAGLVYLVLGAAWYANRADWFGWGGDAVTRDDLVAVLLLAGGFAGAAILRSRVLLHASLALAGPFVLFNAMRLVDDTSGAFIVFGFWLIVGLGAFAAVRKEMRGARTIMGWSAWHGPIAFALAGIDTEMGIAHRIAWIALSVGVIAAGASVRQNWAIAGGVISLIAACTVTLVDLGMSLGTSAAIFGVAALVILGVALVMARRQRSAP